jgi:hypothetical protein
MDKSRQMAQNPQTSNDGHLMPPPPSLAGLEASKRGDGTSVTVFFPLVSRGLSNSVTQNTDQEET